jgi:putative two-component system response regulator
MMTGMSTLSRARHTPVAPRHRILIADDIAANVRLLETILSAAGYGDIESTTDGNAVVATFRACRPDIVLLDLHMPGADGLDIIRQLRGATGAEPGVPVIVLTGDASANARRATLEAGASDFVAKPYDAIEVVLRVRNLLETRRLQVAMARENRSLEQRVQERTDALLAARFEVLERLAVATEMRDDDTGEHTRRVGRLAAQLAHRLGVSEDAVELIGRAAPLHDIGKIAIPDSILKKPGPLTVEEFAVMKTHTTVGANILAGGDHALILTAERIALAHHERWDGSGYPYGLRDEEIPLEGRIVAVADFYDALTHDRCYRRAFDRDVVISMVRAGKGTQFNPDAAAALLDLAAAGEIGHGASRPQRAAEPAGA